MYIWLRVFLVVLACLCYFGNAQLEACQANCESSDRLAGPTRMTNTLPHPWKIAQFPSKNSGFCKLGCQFFYTEFPRNTTCKRMCGYYYRYKVTDGYSDIAEEAKLECQDGCEIALQICQEGYYCSKGIMTECPPGTYREAVTDVSVLALDFAHECTKCPYGRYRSTPKGKSADECTKCPIGKYANVTGSIKVSDCQRCPAGKTAYKEGMRLCECITGDSCDLDLTTIGNNLYFAEEVQGKDYFRETVPFIGRW
jgi:hypothetical protein